MGWIGRMSRVMDCLKARDVAKDEEGRFLVRNGQVATFMGDTSPNAEAVVSDEVEICVDGKWVPLVPLLHGGFRVTVI